MKRVQQFALKIGGVTVLRTDNAEAVLQEIRKHLDEQVKGESNIERRVRLLKSP
jgi:uncharacterized protein with von Willebrand factor type A (vWA) domain